MSGERLSDLWWNEVPGRPCVVKACHSLGAPWVASPARDYPDRDREFKTHAEAIAWLDREVRRAG